MGRGFKMLRVLRMLRALRVLRVFKWLRYSKNFEIISDVIRDSKNSLIAVVSLAAAYILVSALVIFNVEPDSFETFFDAVYWATVSLTTVGYGNIYPVSVLGRIVAMVSSMMGIAIVALPAGIITAGYMEELHKTGTAHPKMCRKASRALKKMLCSRNDPGAVRTEREAYRAAPADILRRRTILNDADIPPGLQLRRFLCLFCMM